MATCYLFDLDGTLTREELLPAIARRVGLEREIGTLTRLTIGGLVPFEESFRLRFAILNSIPLEEIQDTMAEAMLDPHILEFVRGRPEACYVVTGSLDEWVKPLAAKIGCRFFSSRSMRLDGKGLSLDYVMHKADTVLKLREEFDRVVAVGDGANDVPMFECADIGIAYGGVHVPAPNLMEMADYVVNDSASLCRLLATIK